MNPNTNDVNLVGALPSRRSIRIFYGILTGFLFHLFYSQIIPKSPKWSP
jgi:hypothetical protein